MRKAILVLTGIVFALGIFATVAQAADKFASVDLARVNEIKAFQDKINLLTEKEKQEKKSDLEGKVRDLQDFDRQRQTDLRKEYTEKTKEIFKDIEEAIKQYAQKDGLTIVFDDRLLAYKEKGLDITDKVIEILANKAPKK
jgi:outer membrane protein